jgi:hypothetical protein
MKIQVMKKRASRHHKEEIKEYEIPIVTTLREMLIAITEVEYKDRYEEHSLQALTNETLKEQADNGKISFNYVYNNSDTLDKAIMVMLQDFKDGLFRVFHNEVECLHLDEDLDIKEMDMFVFIKLVMLAGRLW